MEVCTISTHSTYDAHAARKFSTLAKSETRCSRVYFYKRLHRAAWIFPMSSCASRLVAAITVEAMGVLRTTAYVSYGQLSTAAWHVLVGVLRRPQFAVVVKSES